MVEWQNLHDVLCVHHVCASCVCVLEIDFVWLDGALLCAVRKCLLLLFVCPPCSSCVRVCCCFSRGACWIELGARAAWFMCLSVSSVVALPWFCVGCLHDGRGDGAQTWHVVWGLLLAACVLRCVAKIVMVEWQTCMMFMCACVHHVLVLEIDLCGSTARCFAGRKCLLLFCVSSVQFVCACVLLFLAWPAGSSWARVLLGSCVFLWRV
jgi:hypothetical protein